MNVSVKKGLRSYFHMAKCILIDTTGCHVNTELLNIEEDDKYQYIDDLDLLELIILTDVLVQYDFHWPALPAPDIHKDSGI